MCRQFVVFVIPYGQRTHAARVYNFSNPPSRSRQRIVFTEVEEGAAPIGNNSRLPLP